MGDGVVTRLIELDDTATSLRTCPESFPFITQNLHLNSSTLIMTILTMAHSVEDQNITFDEVDTPQIEQTYNQIRRQPAVSAHFREGISVVGQRIKPG